MCRRLFILEWSSVRVQPQVFVEILFVVRPKRVGMYIHMYLEYMCVWLVIVLNVSCRIMNSRNVSYGFTGVYSLDRSAAHAPHESLLLDY